MPCNHKFQNYLNLVSIDFEPETLIIGTFNPEISTNKANWFYGRKKNNFWRVLPKLYKKDSLIEKEVIEWKTFCKENRIAITDLISCINDVNIDNPEHISLLKNYSDEKISDNFHDFIFVEIIDLLKKYPTIKNVYFTRKTLTGLWKIRWEPIQKYCKEENIHCRTLLTPSGYASKQMKEKNNPDHLSPVDFILKRWKEEWHF